MKKVRTNILICAILSIVVIFSSFGCSPKNKTSLDYDTKVIEVSQLYTNCGKLDRFINLELEDSRYHPGHSINQDIYTRNVIKFDNQLNKAYSIINCYEGQQKND